MNGALDRTGVRCPSSSGVELLVIFVVCFVLGRIGLGRIVAALGLALVAVALVAVIGSVL